MKRIIFIAILVFAFCFAALAQVGENSCPKVEIITPNQLLNPNQPVNVPVKINENTRNDLDYEWTTSGGRILKGQGTSEIEFAGPADGTTNITVTVKITGLPKGCTDTVSEILPFVPPLIVDPTDAFGRLSSDDLKARLAALLLQVANDPTAEALIAIRFDEDDRRTYKTSRLRNILAALAWLKFDLTRVTFEISEWDNDEVTVIMIIPAGGRFRVFAEKDYKIIKAEELAQTIDELFPKK